MSQMDKLIERICRLPNDIRFDEVRKVLEYCGYITVAPRGGGSHYKFVKKGNEIIVIPNHGIVKRVYLERVKEIIEEEKNENSR